MSIEIDVLNGDASWPLAEPLYDAVWPPDVRRNAAMGRCRLCPCRPAGVGAGASRQASSAMSASIAATVTWNGRKFAAGGIGGVSTRRGRTPPRLRQHRARRGDPDPEATKARPISRCCFANRTMRRSISAAAGSRSTARSMPSNPAGASASLQPIAPYVYDIKRAPPAGRHRPLRPALVTDRQAAGQADMPPVSQMICYAASVRSCLVLIVDAVLFGTGSVAVRIRSRQMTVDIGIARSSRFACYAVLLSGECSMACRFGFIVAILAALLAAPTTRAGRR